MCGKLNAVTKQGEVREFRQELSSGTVVVEGKRKQLQFSSLCFHSNPPFRYPRVGERVRITLSTDTGSVVLVRAIEH